MGNQIDIDYWHSRAIVQEIGERLRAILTEESKLPASLRLQIDQLRELEHLPSERRTRNPRWQNARMCASGIRRMC